MPGRRQKAFACVFGVDAKFKAVAARGRRFAERQRQAVGDTQLLDHQVDAGGFFGHRVLDLQARVDLKERQGAVLAEQELHGARTNVARLGADVLSRLVNARALFFADERRWRLFHQLLVTALQGAIACADNDDLAVFVGQYLGFDVAWAVEELFNETFATPESGFGFAHGGGEHFGDFIKTPSHFHAASATAESGLDGDRQTVLLGKGQHLGGVFDRAGCAGNQWRADQMSQFARLDLVAQHINGLGVGANPDQTGVDHRSGEVGPLRQKAIAWVHGVCPAAFGDSQQLFNVQVGLGRALAVQRISFVGLTHVQRVNVGVSVDGNRLHTVVAASASDADGDFTTVGDQ
ncbi:hypothetical protein KPSA3_07199 [Pseudomonas syringae pv. actinidiae]|uniref:Uncharacterized protein n=1 Tax=Pseudomonas syringae pv. actinidiae TaxID=103796 RepID=A0AAN4QBU3_PSESF|nr:hypothetical protein KPSA3_07199 [Pseudomonas syringae pv. actinidiae]